MQVALICLELILQGWYVYFIGSRADAAWWKADRVLCQNGSVQLFYNRIYHFSLKKHNLRPTISKMLIRHRVLQGIQHIFREV